MMRSTLMKCRLLVFILVPSFLYANIVFVHLGSQIPNYLYVALEQARLFNKDAAIYLVANQEAITNSKYDFGAQKLSAIPCETLAPSEHHKIFIQKTPLDAAYREGFWRKATERFFYIHEFMVSRNLTHVVHLESDNMLYVDIATMQQALACYEGIGAVFDSDKRCIPSFVYIANGAAITDLIKFIAEYAANGFSDMEIVAAYRMVRSPQQIDNLPLIMPEYSKDHALGNLLQQKPRNPSAYSKHIDLFTSIFDGAALGQYLGGIDPRNGPSQPGFINETCFFNPSYLAFEWRKDDQGRKVPFAIYGEVAYRINNLHIHSKQLENFRS